MKRNAQGRIDLSLDGLVTPNKPLASQPAVIEANREVSRVAEPIAATRFEGLDPFTLSLIEQNPIVPRVEPRPKPSEPAKTLVQPDQARPEPQKGSGSLDGLFMMLGAALATGAGGLALAKTKPAQGPAMPAPQASVSPAPAFHIPTR
ncbi:hypothetical protein [Meiothermus sp. CFH 77666]|uniref:hypothetical protein n=1 Tax=Meiothermus sp. CFH 77666 TaxID=2817942 RepID=UPI001AA087F2|nr:hypothetical protein [Meiothermus sp. CFH 77666]MBO1438329.1 hypothetical protein [Meiothermus sp. CFH 77666]